MAKDILSKGGKDPKEKDLGAPKAQSIKDLDRLVEESIRNDHLGLEEMFEIRKRLFELAVQKRTIRLANRKRLLELARQQQEEALAKEIEERTVESSDNPLKSD